MFAINPVLRAICRRNFRISTTQPWQHSSIDMHRVVQLVDVNQPTTPWFDSDCAAARRRARMLERRYRVSRNIHDRAAWSKQVRLKQQLYSQKQYEYWGKRISESRGDPKKLWRSLSSVLRKEITKLPDSDELSANRFSDAFQAKLDRFVPRQHPLPHQLSMDRAVLRSFRVSICLMLLPSSVSSIRLPPSTVSWTLLPLG